MLDIPWIITSLNLTLNNWKILYFMSNKLYLSIKTLVQPEKYSNCVLTTIKISDESY